jgi:hypothetical protein
MPGAVQLTLAAKGLAPVVKTIKGVPAAPGKAVAKLIDEVARLLSFQPVRLPRGHADGGRLGAFRSKKTSRASLLPSQISRTVRG